MLAPGLLVWAKFVHVPKDAQVVEVMAQQWHWSYRLPGKDGKLGTVHSRFVSDGNPFGMNPADPNGQDDVLLSSPELHVPLGQAGEGAAALQGRVAQLLGGPAPRQDGHGAGPGHVYLVHAHAHGILRPALRGTLRHRALRDAWQVSWWTSPPPSRPGWPGSRPYAQAHARPRRRTAAAGKAAYAVCAACHGAKAKATWR